MTTKSLDRTIVVIALLSILCQVGCVVKPLLTHTPQSLPTALPSVTPTTSTPVSPCTIIPNQTPNTRSSPTPHPLLNSSVLQDITIFFAHSEGRTAEEIKTTELYKIKGDGSGKQKLFGTERLGGDFRALLNPPRLSNDGQRLAFIQFVDERGLMAHESSSLWLINVDGSSAKELVGGSDLWPGTPNWSENAETTFWTKEKPVSPIWSPNDSLIAFMDSLGFPHEPGSICILDTKSEQWWKLAQGNVFDWAPDSDALAIHNSSRYASVHGLQILNLDGTTISIIELPPSVFLLYLNWSAVTGLVVAQGRDREQPEIYPIFVIDPHDKSMELVVEDSYEGYGPQWSPNGAMISFELIDDYMTRDLYVLDLASGNTWLIMHNVIGGGVWSSDSRLVLVHSKAEGDGLYIVSVSDRQYWKVPDTEGASSQAWLFLSQ